MGRPAKVWFRKFDRNWYITLDGRKVNLYVKGEQNEALAWQAYSRLLTAPTDPPPVRPGDATVRQVVEAFLAYSAERVGKKARVLYAQYLTNFAVKHGDLPARQATGPFIESYSRAPHNPDARKPKWSESTRSTFLAVVVRAFRHAERAGLIEKTPIRSLKPPPIRKRGAECLISPDEFRKIRDAASAPFRPILEFVWLTGCRPSEAAQLTAGDIEWGSDRIVVREHKTSRLGQDRWIALTPKVRALLAGLIEKRPTGFLFRTRYGSKWATNVMDTAFRDACRRSGVGGKVLYGLRHSFLTDALEKLPEAQVAELAGHKGTRTLHASYNHLHTKTKMLAEAAAKVR